MFKVVVLYLILFLHLSGLVFRWYWLVPEYDTFIHFLGGFWVALMGVYLVKKYFPKRKDPSLAMVIMIVMIIGLGWEGYEFLADTFIFHKNPVMQGSVFDTITDLTADLLGALFYYWLISFCPQLFAERRQPALRRNEKIPS